MSTLDFRGDYTLHITEQTLNEINIAVEQAKEKKFDVVRITSKWSNISFIINLGEKQEILEYKANL